MLIEETERTFYRGMIVTAQVVRVFEGRDDNGGFALCKLDNGLDAKIEKNDLENSMKVRIDEMILVGHVVTGRIEEIRDKEEAKFSVSLNCKRKDLEWHTNYAPKDIINIPQEDLINPTFKNDGKSH